MRYLFTKEEAKQLFETKIRPLLGPIEKQRLKVYGKLKVKTLQVVAVSAIAAVIIYNKVDGDSIVDFYFFLTTLAATYYYFSVKKIIKPYRQNFKQIYFFKFFKA